MIRAIQWATGAMGRTALRRIIDHPGLDLAGVYVYTTTKIGTDAGTIARRPPTGVLATNDRAEILATAADVVVHTPRITLPYEALADDVEALLRSGKNVVSTAGFHWPAAQGESYARRLHDAALAGGVTLAGVGVNPGLVVERITLAAAALCAEIDTIRVAETVDASHMASAEFVFELMGLGSDPAERDIRRGPLADLYTALFSEVFHCAAHALGTSVVGVTPDHRLTIAPRKIVIPAGTIPAGTVAATEWRWLATFANATRFELAILWTADPALHGAERRGHWDIRISGRPDIHLTIDISESDPAAPPSRALTDATMAVAINAIPAVVAAPPGLFAFRAPGLWSGGA